MSLITVRNDLTFLDLTVQQVEHLNQTYDTDVPLVLMNSVDTDDQTRKVLRKYKGRSQSACKMLLLFTNHLKLHFTPNRSSSEDLHILTVQISTYPSRNLNANCKRSE